MRTRPCVHCSKLDIRGRSRAFAFVLALAAGVLGPEAVLASTRDDIDRLNAQVAGLAQKVREIESQQQQIRNGLTDIASRLDAIARASQTADLRTDLDQIKRQVEILSSQLSSLKGEALRRMPLPEPVQAGLPQPPVPEPPPSPPSSEQADSIYSQALKDFNLGRYDLAASQFREFLETSPQDPKAGNALYWVGECLYSQQRFKDAKDTFSKLLDMYPQSPKTRAARLKLGRCLIELGETKKGRQIFESLAVEFPDSEEGKLAESYLESGEGR